MMLFERSADTTALVASDHNERNKYRLERERGRQIKSLQDELAALKAQVAGINSLVEQIIREKK